MVSKFLRNLVGVKTDQAVQGAMEALVRWDPKGATEAELRGMEQQLDGLGMRVAEAKQIFQKEKREADTIVALFDQRVAAAEALSGQVEGAEGARKAELEKSLNTLLTMIEGMTSDVEREKQEAADAQEFLELLEGNYNEAGTKLRTARSELETAQRQMARADQQREMAERRSQVAREAAGLAGATSGINVALKAMQDAANKDLASADAANAKAKLLTPTKPEKDDPNIAAAMDEAQGRSPTPTSLTDRLAALRSAKTGS